MMEPDEADGGARRPLLMTRLRRLATPLAVLLAGLLAVTLGYRGPVLGAVAIVLGVVVVALWLRARPADDGGDDAY